MTPEELQALVSAYFAVYEPVLWIWSAVLAGLSLLGGIAVALAQRFAL